MMTGAAPKTFQAWKDARQQLDMAIQRYLGCSAELGSYTQNNPTSSSNEPPGLVTTILDAYEDAPTTSSRIAKLRKAQQVLTAMRNGPSPLTPIQRLPSDVLYQIFSLIVTQPRCDTYYFHSETQCLKHKPDARRLLWALGAVCTYWRTIITETSSFWSHIDVDTDHLDNLVSRYAYMKSCLERARNSRVHLCVHARRTRFHNRLDRVITLLCPYLPNLGVLQVHGCRHTGISNIVSSWLENGHPDSLHALLLSSSPPSRTNCNPRIELPDWSEIDLFLEPIRALHLSGVYFDWTSPIYHNLVELRLTNMRSYHHPNVHVTVSDLLHVLSVCPKLHTLELGLACLQISEKTPLQPVILSDLKRLEIHAGQPGLDVILPKISLGSEGLSVQLGCGSGLVGSESERDALLTFIARNSGNITRFFCRWFFDSMHALDDYLLLLPNLSTLIIPGFRMDFLAKLVTAFQPNIPGVSLCPKLHTLYLIRGKLNTQGIQAIFQAKPSIKKLRLLSSILEPSEEEVMSELASSVDVRYEPNTPFWFSELV